MPNSMPGLLAMWSGAPLEGLLPRGQLVWRCIPTIVCWVVWVECNSQIFNNKLTDPVKLPQKAFGLLVQVNFFLAGFQSS